jgi:DNA-binding PadR family transcriptional regulator
MTTPLRMTLATRAVLDALATGSVDRRWYVLEVARAARIDRSVAGGVLRRLERSGYLTSWREDQEDVPAGRPPRRYYGATTDPARRAELIQLLRSAA